MRKAKRADFSNSPFLKFVPSMNRCSEAGSAYFELLGSSNPREQAACRVPLRTRVHRVLCSYSMEPQRATRSGLRARHCWALLFLIIGGGCDKTLVVGTCEPPKVPVEDSGTDAGLDAGSDAFPLELPWSSGFENGFCDFNQPLGYCLQSGTASYKFVTSPVHSGTFAAAFTINDDPNALGRQSRCVRRGVLPKSACYGAWFYLPRSRIVANHAWDLSYFRRGDVPVGNSDGLWDVYLTSDSNGDYWLAINDYVHSVPHFPDTRRVVQGDTWFRLEFCLDRATDNTGRVALRQDDQEVFSLQDIQTDKGEWAEWYVGSYSSDGLIAGPTTLYVDDVTINDWP